MLAAGISGGLASGGLCVVSLTSSPARPLKSPCRVPASSVPGPGVAGCVLSLLFPVCLACLREASSAI